MGSERRIHARVETAFDCELRTDSGQWSAKVADLSYGGAMVLGPRGIVGMGESLHVSAKLPMDSEAISIWGEVRRIQDLEEQQCAYGLRFSRVEAAQRDALKSFVEYLLAGSGFGSRDSPRVARRLELRCTSKQEFSAIMRDMSRSGLGLECDQPLLIDEELTLEIRTPEVDTALVVTGRVIHTRPAADEKHHVGLKLGSHSAREKKAIEAFLRRLMSGDRSG